MWIVDSDFCGLTGGAGGGEEHYAVTLKRGSTIVVLSLDE